MDRLDDDSDIEAHVLHVVDQLCYVHNAGAPRHKVIETLRKKLGTPDREIETAIDELLDQGKIYYSRDDSYRVT